MQAAEVLMVLWPSAFMKPIAREAPSEIIVAGIYCLLTMCQALGCALYGFSLNPQGSCIISIHIEVEQAEVMLERLGT